MNKRRLLRLADLLDADAKNEAGVKFNLSGWGSSSTGAPANVSCGTTACAMGLAVLSGAFEQDGLRNGFGPRSCSVIPYFQTGQKVVSGFKAAANLFGISHKAAEWLFQDDHYRKSQWTGAAGERAVARRIRKFVAGEARP